MGAAKYVGLEIEAPKGAAGAQVGKIPVLETDQGCIFSSTAIARYISRISRPAGLYGQNIFEGGMIDSWIEFCTHELEVPMCTWVFPIMGIFEEVPEATVVAKEDVQRALTVLNNHLLHNTYMVGHTITLADISVCCALVDGMRLVLDEGIRKKFGNLMRWFNLCLLQPEFKEILGEVKFCGAAASAAPGKGAKLDKQDKGDKKEQPAKKEVAPKKEGKKDAAPKQEAKGKDKKGKDAKESTDSKDAAAEPAAPTEDELKKQRAD